MAPIIEAIVGPNLQLIVQQIDAAIGSFLGGINSLGTVIDVYFLPGRRQCPYPTAASRRYASVRE
ncbi:MAG: hypothetical protein M3546_11800 [Actinomycetota bacterium]|nr:hypothetical protein [Actinomycetota bacterium]